MCFLSVCMKNIRTALRVVCTWIQFRNWIPHLITGSKNICLVGSWTFDFANRSYTWRIGISFQYFATSICGHHYHAWSPKQRIFLNSSSMNAIFEYGKTIPSVSHLIDSESFNGIQAECKVFKAPISSLDWDRTDDGEVVHKIEGRGEDPRLSWRPGSFLLCARGSPPPRPLLWTRNVDFCLGFLIFSLTYP